jgi:hypothetical protein
VKRPLSRLSARKKRIRRSARRLCDELRKLHNELDTVKRPRRFEKRSTPDWPKKLHSKDAKKRRRKLDRRNIVDGIDRPWLTNKSPRAIHQASSHTMPSRNNPIPIGPLILETLLLVR